MKKSYQIGLFTILYFLIQINIYPQNIGDEIQQKVNVQFGVIYEVYDIQNVDENKNKYFDQRLEFTDPYNTLQNCYLFLATSNNPHGSENPKGFIGIYKNGAIIWNSDPSINTQNVVEQYIKGTMEINDDGKVEIITSWYKGMRFTDKYIWIFSWDGNNGYLINDTTDQGGESVIWTEDEKPTLIDLNGDGILEIMGLDANNYNNEDDKFAPLVYSWNGSKYGNYGMQIPQYAPMNLLTAKASCKVTPSQYGLLFTYNVKNDSTSQQSIWQFAVEKMFDLVYKFGAPSNWQGSYSWEWDNLLKWGIIRDSRFYPYNFIEPGSHLDSLNFTNDSILPYITSYYIQGKNGDSFPDDQYIFENSFKGLTICGTNPPDPFLPLDFLDTLLNYNQRSFELGWISNQITVDKYDSLFNVAKTQLQQNNNPAAINALDSVLTDVEVDSGVTLTSEAYALIKYNTEHLKEHLTQPHGLPHNVRLLNSQGQLLTGGSLQYYDGGWKAAVNNGDGTFLVDTERSTVSLRMSYEGGNETRQNVPIQGAVVNFKTINSKIELHNSQNQLMPAPMGDEGSVQYYAGSWRDFGATAGGVASKELLPLQYSFRMTYAHASIDKQQNIGQDSVVVFQTVNAQAELRDSNGNLMPAPTGDQGTVQYYAGAWREFGTTTGGVASMELLPKQYSFRMTYAYASIDKQQDIGSDPTVVFQTVNARVELRDSNGNLMPAPMGDQGTVQYYAGAWREFGNTSGGIATKELLPKQYSFRMSYAFASIDKQQDISTDPMISFATVLATINVTGQQNQILNGAQVSYYAGAWRTIGETVNGSITRELLPRNYTFRAAYQGTSADLQQDISQNSTVNIQLNITGP